MWSFALISDPMIMVAVGGVDAIPKLTHKWKVILMGICALIYTIDAITYQFLEPKELDYLMTVQATRSEVSLNALLSNATGMMGIFLWKQIIDVIRNKNRCISITNPGHKAARFARFPYNFEFSSSLDPIDQIGPEIFFPAALAVTNELVLI